MLILYVTDLVLDGHTAPAIHVDAVCTQFEKLGHDVKLYAPRHRAFAPSGSYAVVRIPAPRFLLSIFYQPQLKVRLISDILRNSPDLIYVRHSHLLIVPALIGKLFKVPVFLEINGILEQDAAHINQTLRSRILLASGIFSLLEWLNARLATRLIAVTQGIKDYFVAQYHVSPEKISVVPNGVNTDFFTPMPKGGRTPLTVGYLGSLHAWQGVRYFAEAAKLLPDFRFLIVGSGEERPVLEDYVRAHGISNLELRDAIPHGEVPAAINSFDICISYPLKFRDGATSPFKVYEYLACGKPVISSDLASMREEFGDVLTYADAESADSLAQAIQALVADPARRKALGERGRAFVEKGHSWEFVARRIISLCGTGS